MFEIPFNSVRRWMLVVVKCMATQSMGERKHSGRFLTPSPSIPSIDEEQLLKESQAQSSSASGECDFAVMIKGAPEVILR